MCWVIVSRLISLVAEFKSTYLNPVRAVMAQILEDSAHVDKSKNVFAEGSV